MLKGRVVGCKHPSTSIYTTKPQCVIFRSDYQAQHVQGAGPAVSYVAHRLSRFSDLHKIRVQELFTKICRAHVILLKVTTVLLKSVSNFYTVFQIFLPTWVKFGREDIYVIPLSICECPGYMCSEWHILPTDTKNISPIFYIFRPISVKYCSRGPQKLFSDWEFCKNRCNKRQVYIFV